MTMKKLLTQVGVGLLVSGAVATAFAGGPDMPSMVTPGIYLGLGGSWNTVDMSVNTSSYVLDADLVKTEITNANLKDSQSRLAPMAQLGYWGMIDDTWLWGLVAEYKYLNYNLNTINGSSDVAFPNVDGEQPGYGNLAVNLQHEFMMLLYFGATFDKGYLYLGFGPVLFTLRDSIRNYYVAAAGDAFQGVGSSDTLWGGAAQLGYNYYFNPTWFLGFNYTYTVTGNYTESSNLDGWRYNSGGTAEDANNVGFDRNYGFTVQEVMFSINKVFEV